MAACWVPATGQVDFSGGAYLENFNGLPASGSVNISAQVGESVALAGVIGWYGAKLGGNGTGIMTLNANNGTQTGGRLYAYGEDGSSERALGMLGSGTHWGGVGVVLRNASGETIERARLWYRHELWVVQGTTGGSVAEDRVRFAYGLGGSGITVDNFLTSAQMEEFAELDAVSLASNTVLGVASGTEPSRARDGNLEQWSAIMSAELTNLNWQLGQLLFLRWSDTDTSGFDAGHGIDDFSLTAVVNGVEMQERPIAGIRIDGQFDDWERRPDILHRDTTGDGWPDGLDFHTVGASVGADGMSVYIRTVEPFVIGSSALQIRIDSDGDPATGGPFLGLGWDVMLDFGVGQSDLRFYPAEAVYHSGARLPAGEFISELLPNGLNPVTTHPESDRYELLIPWKVLPNLRPGGRIGIALRDGSNARGDLAPDLGANTFQVAVPEHLFIEYEAPGLDRIDPTHVRIASWNVLADGPTLPLKEEIFARQLIATRPDIINFQEMWVTGAAWIKGFLDRWLPLEDGGVWHVVKYGDCATASRFPIKRFWSIQPRNLVVWLDTAAELGMDTVIINAHTKAHEEFQEQRMRETDALIDQVRRLRQRLDPTAPEGDFMVFAVGDYNANSPKRELTQLRTGSYSRASQQSLNFWPDAYGRPLVDAAPRHPHSQRISTWQSLTSGNTQRLDYFFYPETRVTLQRSFNVETSSMPADLLHRYGLQATDARVSDHILMIADFRPRQVDYIWQAVDHLEDGWFDSHWFGPVYPFDGGFAYHPTHGIIYPVTGEWGCWIWDPQVGWWFTDGVTYPFGYSRDTADWLYFGHSSPGQRRVFDYASGSWLQTE